MSDDDDEIHVGDHTKVTRTIYDEDGSIEDLTGATTKVFVFKKTNGDAVNVDLAFETDGSDGIVYYQVVAGTFFDQLGHWKLQGKFVLSTGREFKTKIEDLPIYENLTEEV